MSSFFNIHSGMPGNITGGEPLICSRSENLFLQGKGRQIQSNLVITNSSGPAEFVRYNRVDLCSEITILD